MPKVSYVQVEPQNYKLVWSDVNDIRKIVPKNQTENTIEDEVVTTKGKNYVGVIISQQIGKKITIKTSTSTVEFLLLTSKRLSSCLCHVLQVCINWLIMSIP